MPGKGNAVARSLVLDRLSLHQRYRGAGVDDATQRKSRDCQQLLKSSSERARACPKIVIKVCGSRCPGRSDACCKVEPASLSPTKTENAMPRLRRSSSLKKTFHPEDIRLLDVVFSASKRRIILG